MMKSTGIVTRVDDLGRIILPVQLRNALGIVGTDALEIHLEQESIILKKYNNACIFCGRETVTGKTTD